MINKVVASWRARKRCKAFFEIALVCAVLSSVAYGAEEASQPVVSTWREHLIWPVGVEGRWPVLGGWITGEWEKGGIGSLGGEGRIFRRLRGLGYWSLCVKGSWAPQPRGTRIGGDLGLQVGVIWNSPIWQIAIAPYGVYRGDDSEEANYRVMKKQCGASLQVVCYGLPWTQLVQCYPFAFAAGTRLQLDAKGPADTSPSWVFNGGGGVRWELPYFTWETKLTWDQRRPGPCWGAAYSHVLKVRLSRASRAQPAFLQRMPRMYEPHYPCLSLLHAVDKAVSSDILAQALAAGMDPNRAIGITTHDSLTSVTWLRPLPLAILKDRGDLVSVLLNKGVDVNLVDSCGDHPLYKAVVWGRKDIVGLLLEKGADANGVDHEGRTVLHWAVRLGNAEVVELLLGKGADANGVDHEGCTVLHRAVELGNAEVVELLLDRGADANGVDHEGRAVLHRAVELGNAEVVKLLLGRGADASVVDHKGRTVLHRAVRLGNAEVVELLLGRGADASVVDHAGYTALNLAYNQGFAGIIEQLTDIGQGQA